MSTVVTTAIKHNASVDSNIALDSNGRVGIGTATPASALDVIGVARISSDLLFNSGFGSTAVAYGCRAWVNFNGTGTVAIRASGNVSSITDIATGNYRVNFTNAMPDANYAVIAFTENNIGTNVGLITYESRDQSTTQTGILRVLMLSGVMFDPQQVFVTIFR